MSSNQLIIATEKAPAKAPRLPAGEIPPETPEPAMDPVASEKHLLWKTGPVSLAHVSAVTAAIPAINSIIYNSFAEIKYSIDPRSPADILAVTCQTFL